ncbi:unnamed protein product, partial [Heligmosomoides polygyrus]|uniref:PHM7_cyt domain-containing protein n=1 Tax=Heligmosomoides polygyrus TaxID=6339 RepID=A0A183F9S9_HELPZ
MTTSEIILSVQDELETNVLIDDDICTVSNVVLTGCYNCAKGAEARINCKSSKNVQAEITCNDTSFTALITSWLDGHANDINEIQWPDIYHIADVFLQWYKTLILALGALVFALLVTMSVIDVDEKAFLSRMVHNPHQEWAPVDRDLQLFYDALQQQIRLTTVLQRQWIELGKDDHVALATPAARILLIVRRLDAVRVTRDHISRAGSRFVVTNLLYKDMVPDTAREEMGRRVEEVLRLMDEHRTLLTTLISGMEKDLLKAENDFRTGPCSTNVEQVNALFRRAFDTLTWSDKDKSEKRFAELQSKIEEQAHELATLKEQLTSKASCEDKAAEMAPSDSDYFHNMVEEVMGPEEPPPLVDEPSDDDEGDGEGSFDESEVGTIDEYQEEGLDEIRVDEPMEVAVHEQRVVEWVWQAPAPDERRDRVEDEGRQVDEQAQEVRPPEEVDQRVEAMNEEDE